MDGLSVTSFPVVLIRLWLLLLLAVPNYAAGVSVDATQFVKVNSEKVLAQVLANKSALKADPRRLYGLIRTDVLPHFDFYVMSRSILGKNWPKATRSEQKEFVNEFSHLLVRTYGTALLNYSGQAIEYKPAQLRNKDKVAIVRTKVPNAGSSPVDIDYRLHDENGVWKVVDIKIGSVSLVSNYRTNFSSLISQNGIGGLIKQLKAKNAR